jgi:hypothetical protein
MHADGDLQRRRVLRRPNFGFHAFITGEANGTWGTTEEVPGTAALNRHNATRVEPVSYASAGNCGAGGYYTGKTRQQAFAVRDGQRLGHRGENPAAIKA